MKDLPFAKPKKKKSKFGRLVIDSADKWFSLYIRTRDKWTCVRCRKQYDVGSQSLQCSHFFGRTMESVRFDPENRDALCFGCHRYWEKEDREGYRHFKLQQLGARGFNALMVRAFTTGKKDRKMQAIIWKLAYEEL